MENVFKSFVKYVSLNVLAMIAIAACIFIDTFFISKALGMDGLTSLNLAIPIYGTVNGIGLMLGVGGGARYSILKAQNKDEEANKVFTLAVMMGVMIALCWMIVGLFFSEQIAMMFGAQGHILTMTAGYLRVFLLLSGGLILTNTFGGFVRNDGEPKLAMYSTVIFSVLNVIFDYLFIILLEWGMPGAALATSLASLCGFIFLLICWIRKKTNLKFVKTKLTFKGIKAVVETGAPALIGELSSAVVMTVFNLIILTLKGNVGVAAFGIVANLSFIAIAIFNGIGQGMQPIASMCYGKKSNDGLKKVLKYSLITVISFSVLIYSFSFIFTDALTNIFNQEGDILLRELANQGVKIYFAGFIFVGVNAIITIFLSVTGAPRAGFILSMLRSGIIIVPTVLLLSNLFGITGVWLSYPVTEMIVLLVAIFCLFRVKKLNAAVEA